MRRAVVFDLDDTLYLERDYVRSGFRHVSRYLAEQCSVPESQLYDYLWNAFTQGLRGTAFDDLIRNFGLQVQAAELVSEYRDHPPEISLASSTVEILQSLVSDGYQLGLITDGRAGTQRRKIASLRLADIFDEIIPTDSLGREYWKPHPRAFREMQASLRVLNPQDLMYVGDNPSKDFVAPNDLGWRSTQLSRAGQLYTQLEPPTVRAEPHHRVASLLELHALLAAWQ